MISYVSVSDHSNSIPSSPIVIHIQVQIIFYANDVACETTRTFLNAFFSKSKNVTYTFFWVVAYVFSNTGVKVLLSIDVVFEHF